MYRNDAVYIRETDLLCLGKYRYVENTIIVFKTWADTLAVVVVAILSALLIIGVITLGVFFVYRHRNQIRSVSLDQMYICPNKLFAQMQLAHLCKCKFYHLQAARAARKQNKTHWKDHTRISYRITYLQYTVVIPYFDHNLHCLVNPANLPTLYDCDVTGKL